MTVLEERRGTTAIERAEADPDVAVIILTGTSGAFCAGADLRALAEGELKVVSTTGPGPMGPTRLHLATPTIAAIEGPAVAGGLELALWCDLRVVARMPPSACSVGASESLSLTSARYGCPVSLGTAGRWT